MEAKSENASDEGQINKAKQKVESKRDQELNDMRFVLAHPQGRRVMWRMLERCGVYRTSFTGNSTTFFNEGERNVGLKLLADIEEADLDAYIKMKRETKGDR